MRTEKTIKSQSIFDFHPGELNHDKTNPVQTLLK